MIVWICTDMEGLAGVDTWEQCYDEDDDSPNYLYGREQLTAEVNAAVAGCFDGGATEVRVLDGHGRNRGRGFIPEKLDPRVTQVGIKTSDGVILEGLDESVAAVMVIGQHAMSGTLNGFLDHTQMPKMLCRFLINGEEHGETSEIALHAGHFNVPLVYVSGDEALGLEVERLFPGVAFTPTKRGTGWDTCELYPPDEVRANMRRDIAAVLRSGNWPQPWKLETPIEITTEWAWASMPDRLAKEPGVERPHPRIVRWRIGEQRHIHSWPDGTWLPLH